MKVFLNILKVQYFDFSNLVCIKIAPRKFKFFFQKEILPLQPIFKNHAVT